jgi:hypothetical protein
MGRFKRHTSTDPQKGKKNRMGAPPKYNPNYHPQEAYELCLSEGARLEDLAAAFQVTYETICAWWRTHPEFSYMVKKGKDIHDTSRVEVALLKRALGYDYDEIKTEHVEVSVDELKKKLGINGGALNPQRRRRRTNGKNGKNGGADTVVLPGVKITRTTKHVLPSEVAIFFWLVNRAGVEEDELTGKDRKRWMHASSHIKMEVGGRVRNDHHVMDWTKLGVALGKEKLEQLRNIMGEVPASYLPDSGSGGSSPGRGESKKLY